MEAEDGPALAGAAPVVGPAVFAMELSGVPGAGLVLLGPAGFTGAAPAGGTLPGRLPSRALVDCCEAWTLPSAFSMRSRRALSSSSESLRDWTWPESWSFFWLEASWR